MNERMTDWDMFFFYTNNKCIGLEMVEAVGPVSRIVTVVVASKKMERKDWKKKQHKDSGINEEVNVFFPIHV